MNTFGNPNRFEESTEDGAAVAAKPPVNFPPRKRSIPYGKMDLLKNFGLPSKTFSIAYTAEIQ